MPSNLKSGAFLKKTRGRVTRKQTGKQARKKITKKYGSVKDNALYYHRGRGNWTQFSALRDRNRKSKKRGNWSPARMHKGDRRGSKI